MNSVTQWPILPILLPLLTGSILLLFQAAPITLRRRISVTSALALLILNAWLFASLGEQQLAYSLGNWPAPFGIVLVYDSLSGLMLLLTSLLALPALWYAVANDTDQLGRHFHILFQLQLFGLNGAFLTGDAFNLFVFFEVLLLASYSLMLHGGGKQRTVAGLHYVVVNLVGSTVFLFALGALYGALGTLNMADMAARVAALPAEREGLVKAAGLLLLVVFGLKAAMFPLYLWLPGAYARTSAPVAALFAIMTKVGIYAIIRVHGSVFGADAGSLAHFYAPYLLGLGMITLVLAAIGVLAGIRIQFQIAYLVLASVATLLIGVGLGTEEGLTATLYYLIHSTLLAGGLFLLVDMIVKVRGAYAGRIEPGLKMPRHVLLGGIFMVAMIAAVGLPPLSGFFGKLWLLQASIEHPWHVAIFTTVILGSFIMLFAMARSGSILFYKAKPNPDEADPVFPDDNPAFNKSLPSLAWLLSATLLLVLFANPVSQRLEGVVAQLSDLKSYRSAVLNTPATQGD